MQFFDLNIPYVEGDKSIPDKSAKKQNRLRLIIKAMELGYTGIAYNRTIKGAMSESDRCTIPPFPLSSLINVAPSLSSAVSFHRRLLGVPEKVPFRQYTRFTVMVDTSAQASALNSGNPVLKTYDLIAVRPLNQTCFDHACQSSQVDLISINFTEKLPFRLKFPMVKAAIARGVYFEIMYSGLMDAQARRQLISNAKLLVDWTRGKNLIVSSAAPSVLELRGPNDVSNFLSMLGLSNEQAKAAISKNCRLLIANALRKKQFYKEAIRVEVMPAGAQTDCKEPWLVDYLDWDPISSGEGDLCLDDMAKSFANSGKVSQTVKAIDFASIVNSGKSHGLQVKDDDFTVQAQPYQPVNAMCFTSKDVEVSKDTEKPQKEPTPFHSNKSDEHGSALEILQQAMVVDFPKASLLHEDLRISSSIFLQDLDKTDGLEGNTSGHKLELQKHVACDAEDMLISSNSIKETPPEIADLDVECGVDSKEEVSTKVEDVNGSGVDADSRLLVSYVFINTDAGVSAPLQSADRSELSHCPYKSLNGHILPLTENPELNTNSIDTDMNLDSFIKRNGSDISIEVEEITKDHDQREEHHNEVDAYTNKYLFADTSIQVDSSPVTKDTDDIIVPKCMLPEDVTLITGKQVEEISRTSYSSLVRNKSGNYKGKPLASDQVCRFPFKRLLQGQFKKKGRKSSYKSKR